MATEKQIEILTKLKEKLSYRLNNVRPEEINPENEYIWVGGQNGLVGNLTCHYEFIFQDDETLNLEVHFEEKKNCEEFKDVLSKKYKTTLEFADWEKKHKRIIGKNDNYHIKINRMPKIHENIKIVTWPSEERKLGAIRDFMVFDENQKEIITATSQWILIDFVRKRPVALKDKLPQYKVVNEHSLVSDFEKLPEPENIYFNKNFSVRFDDIDINMHVNNSLYPLWATEGLPHEFRENNLPQEIEISFKKEGHLGEDIEVVSSLSSNVSLHSIRALSDNRELSRIRIKWCKK